MSITEAHRLLRKAPPGLSDHVMLALQGALGVYKLRNVLPSLGTIFDELADTEHVTQCIFVCEDMHIIAAADSELLLLRSRPRSNSMLEIS